MQLQTQARFSRLHSGLRLVETLGRPFRAMVGRSVGPVDETVQTAPGPAMTLAHRPVGAALNIDADADDDVSRLESRRAELTVLIQQHNPSASDGWLDGFSDRALETYLAHLRSADVPRGRSSTWVRPNDTPAVQAWLCNVD